MRKPRPRRLWKYREDAKKLRGKLCENCGSSENLTVHHKNEDYTDNTPANVQTLCYSCHLIHHWQTGLYKTPEGKNPYLDKTRKIKKINSLPLFKHAEGATCKTTRVAKDQKIIVSGEKRGRGRPRKIREIQVKQPRIEKIKKPQKIREIRTKQPPIENIKTAWVKQTRKTERQKRKTNDFIDQINLINCLGSQMWLG